MTFGFPELERRNQVQNTIAMARVAYFDAVAPLLRTALAEGRSDYAIELIDSLRQLSLPSAPPPSK